MTALAVDADGADHLQRLAPLQNDVGTDGLVESLRAASTPVTIVSVGSLSHIAAALEAEEDLVLRTVRRVVVVAGDAEPLAEVETNVWVDDDPFVSVMTSGLPIRWVPAFDGGLWSAGTCSSFVPVAQAEMLASTRQALLNLASERS